MSIVGIVGSGGMAAAIGGLAAKAGHTGLAKNGAGTWDFALNVDLG
jgi:hypothetical protein